MTHSYVSGKTVIVAAVTAVAFALASNSDYKALGDHSKGNNNKWGAQKCGAVQPAEGSRLSVPCVR